MMIRLTTLQRGFLASGFALLVAGSASAQEMALNQDSIAIQATSQAWEHAVKTRDVAATLAVLAEDARMVPPGKPPITGHAAIREFYTEAFKDPAFAVVREPTRIEASTDLAYSMGDYRRYASGKDGEKATALGSYVVIWKKQPDKSWKVAVDIWNMK